MSKYRTSDEIRADFLNFFQEKQHQIVPSASLIPGNDPTLLFTNAGMNQFKDVFLGTGSRPYRRAADTQKCLRVSGKHNDLEEVGYDTYHHTLFEMLGNWSFGDYFKKEAIRWAWELLVDRWGLEPDRLYATVHAGDEALGLEPDTEAAEYWKSETSINPEHVLFGSTKDNFWMMGDTGPCGPCSEVHIDLRPDEERRRLPGNELVNANDPRVMEIWNLVFIQYNALPGPVLEPLKAKHVDTGMGFERVVAVLQGKSSNYDTDIFAPLLEKVASLSPINEIVGYDDIKTDDETERERYRVAMRVVADHIRAIGFAIADGVSPGNVGRGYVIRRILRRAVRYGYQTLGFRRPFLYQLYETLAERMGHQFPELVQQKDYVQRIIEAEEQGFLETLGTGIAFFERVTPYIKELSALEENANGKLERVLDSLKKDRHTLDLLEKAYGDDLNVDQALDLFSNAAARRNIPGEVAFLLHDTYGFPVDLTQLMAREEGLAVDMPRYEQLMQQQKNRARAATTFKVDQSAPGEWERISDGEDSVFVGYDEPIVENSRIRAARTIVLGEHEFQYQLMLDHTPFYAESGGQVGDTGTLTIGDETIQVLDTQKLQDKIVHVVDRLPEALDAPVRAVIDTDRRLRIMKHHTATHLLHAVLRRVLGPHVAQKGSLVAPDRLRFDFSHFERVSPEQLREIELQVNDAIQRNIPKLEERHVPIDEARARGAMALFGEKYGDYVRVITFDPEFSVELCGGTHVDATGQIGTFHFLSEGSVAAGVRRVEAVTGRDALDLIHQERMQLERVRGQFKTLNRPVDEEVANLLAQTKTLERELERLRQERLVVQLDAFIRSASEIGGLRVVTGRFDHLDMEGLRNIGQTLRDRLGERSIGVLGAIDPEGQKVYLVASVSDDVIRDKKVQAGALVGRLAKLLGGGGGGRPTLATAGGKEPAKLDEVLASVPQIVGEMIES